MKKSLLLFFVLHSITVQAALPTVLNSIHETYQEYQYTSKVIGGTCSILAGSVIAAAKASQIQNKPYKALLPAGLILTGAALLKLAYNETHQYTGYDGPFCFCTIGCDKNPKGQKLFIPHSGIRYCPDCKISFRGTKACLHCSK